ncbi:hypothetical protein [Flavobacterium sp.]|uniref:hypothetical protein n=1 Tax=Flavobacterium sp. TaxID=239 RepID=UPI0037522B16
MGIIKKISFAETFSIKHPVLRKGKPMESCHFEGDNLETTQHFGLYLEQELVGVFSLFKKATRFSREKSIPNQRNGCFRKSKKKRFWQST